MRTLCKFALLFCCFYTPKGFTGASDIKFEKKTLNLANNFIIVELADSNEKTERGLMYRKSLNENEGMLFVFPNESRRSFWMKNTFINLSIAFFDRNKTIIEIYDMKASASELTNSPDSCETKKKAQFALEMSRGWFKKHNIKVGDKFNFASSK